MSLLQELANFEALSGLGSGAQPRVLRKCYPGLEVLQDIEKEIRQRYPVLMSLWLSQGCFVRFASGRTCRCVVMRIVASFVPTRGQVQELRELRNQNAELKEQNKIIYAKAAL